MTEATHKHDTLIALTSDIVSAHVSFNDVKASEVAGLITRVYGALAGLGAGPAAEEQKPIEPAVSIRSSVKPDSITCLECGRKMKMLKRHLSTDHKLGIEEYRERWNLARDYPVVAPDYAAVRRELAQQNGLGRPPKAARGRPARKKLGMF